MAALASGPQFGKRALVGAARLGVSEPLQIREVAQAPYIALTTFPSTVDRSAIT